MLHISAATQKERLLARLDDPHQALEVQPRRHRRARATGTTTSDAYEIALERTNTEPAPWYVVPSDRKWFRNLAIGQLLLRALREMEPGLAGPDFDVEAERARLIEEKPIA